MTPMYDLCSHANGFKVTQLIVDHTCFANETDTFCDEIFAKLQSIGANLLVQK